MIHESIYDQSTCDVIRQEDRRVFIELSKAWGTDFKEPEWALNEECDVCDICGLLVCKFCGKHVRHGGKCPIHMINNVMES
jgi:hypothetical protein